MRNMELAAESRAPVFRDRPQTLRIYLRPGPGTGVKFYCLPLSGLKNRRESEILYSIDLQCIV